MAAVLTAEVGQVVGFHLPVVAGLAGKEEIRARFGDVPNVEMECSECMQKYVTPMKEACPEWNKECRLKG